jgi:1-acyl-sn-glycerol-3-phosphate acyltransferase
MKDGHLGVTRLTLVTLTSIVVWSLGALWFLAMGLVFLPLRRWSGARRLGQRLLRSGFSLYVQVLRGFGIVTIEYVGFDKLAGQSSGYIVAPNHPAMWDVVFLLSRLEPMTCIFKASLLRNPLLLGGAMLAGLIPNAPAIRMVKRAVEVLGTGGRVLFFPEGTRTRKREGVLNPLQGSMGLVAKHSQVPVWPVMVQTDSDFLSKGWPVWRLPRKKTHLRMRVGEPLSCGVDEPVDAFNDRLRASYLNSLE